jgi:hypothetical protein
MRDDIICVSAKVSVAPGRSLRREAEALQSVFHTNLIMLALSKN